MSILYKAKEDIKYSVDIEILPSGNIHFDFYCDGGKHGTDEGLCEYEFTTKQLLNLFISSKIYKHI